MYISLDNMVFFDLLKPVEFVKRLNNFSCYEVRMEFLVLHHLSVFLHDGSLAQLKPFPKYFGIGRPILGRTLVLFNP